jgi:hypothetical protein
MNSALVNLLKNWFSGKSEDILNVEHLRGDHRVLSRRKMITRAAAVAAASAMQMTIAACERKASPGPKLTCTNAGNVSGELAELQEAFHYVDAFPEISQMCSECIFFTQPQDGICGNCTVLGAAKSTGHCDAFSENTSL